MFTSHLLFAFTILRHMVTVYADCNYAILTKGANRALDLCFTTDSFDVSFKYVYISQINQVQERVYGTKNCAGNYYINKKHDVKSINSGTGNTCNTFSYVSVATWYENGNATQTYGDLTGWDVMKPRIVLFGGGLYGYGECFPERQFFMKVIACGHYSDADGLEKDEVSLEYYSDAECTQQIAGDEVTFDDEKSKGADGSIVTEVSYKKKMRESPNVFITFRDKSTTKTRITLQEQDITCYNEQTIQSGEVFGGPQEPVAILHHERYPEISSPFLGSNPYEWKPAPQKPQFYDPNDYDTNWTYLAVNVLVSVVSTLCVVSVCLAAYYWMKRKSSSVEWTKDVDTEV